MSRRLIVFWTGLLCLTLLFAAASAEEAAAQAEPPVPTVAWSTETEAGSLSVLSDTLKGEAWLFLPSSADLSRLSLTVDTARAGLCWQGADGARLAYQQGRPVDWLSLAIESEEGVYSADLVSEADGQTALRLHIMKSAHLRSVHILSDDPENEGREWLEDCLYHDRFASATLVMLRPDGSVSANEWIEKLRGRGNSTWNAAVHKKPYQLKLKNKRDLLESGNPAEANKKWVLLSNEAILTSEKDLSMLRNQIALDLSREFGLTDTSRCEQVDLYYDRCYRGTYLLCEKVEVNPGRVEIPNYDKLLEDMAEASGVKLDELPMGESVNRFGKEIYFTDGVPEPENIQAAGYLLDLERGVYGEGLGTVSDPAWFEALSGQTFSLKNPSRGGVRAVTFASELLEDAYRALTNYGVDPDTGTRVEEWMDVDSFTRSFLMQEITQNNDTYYSGSTYFVIRPNERKLYAGPLWDFDIFTEKVETLRDTNDWMRFFYRDTVFQTAAKRIYANELYPLVRNILLGEKSGKYLKTLTQYQNELQASWSMNYRRFFAEGFTDAAHTVRLESYIDRLRTFYDKQSEWLLTEIESWSENEPSAEVDIVLDSPMGDIARYMTAAVKDAQRSSLYVSNLTLTCLREATQEEYGLWQADITLESKPDCVLSEALTVRINDAEAAYTRVSGSAVQTGLVFENPLYRPAVYDGMDYGLVFHFDYFADNYPDLLEECGGTMEGALQYYVETGMDEGLMCSEYFDPTSIPLNDTWLEAKLQDDWRSYIEWFYVASYTNALDRFVPEAAEN